MFSNMSSVCSGSGCISSAYILPVNLVLAGEMYCIYMMVTPRVHHGCTHSVDMSYPGTSQPEATLPLWNTRLGTVRIPSGLTTQPFLILKVWVLCVTDISALWSFCCDIVDMELPRKILWNGDTEYCVLVQSGCRWQLSAGCLAFLFWSNIVADCPLCHFVCHCLEWTVNTKVHMIPKLCSRLHIWRDHRLFTSCLYDVQTQRDWRLFLCWW